MMKHKFVALILTHGRPEKVYTYTSLRKAGYTGPIVLVCDNEDITIERYKELYKDELYIFDKKQEAKTTDNCDNFQHRKAIVYARNASFRIAKELGYEYFMQLDDDYLYFEYRIGQNLEYCFFHYIHNFDFLLESLLNFYINSNIDALAIAQCGDFIGGKNSNLCQTWKAKRKCMNTWICSIHKPLTFCGHLNEDCSQYVVEGQRGKLFFQIPMLSIKQVDTQKAQGGMTDIYQQSGTYIKTMYTILQAPSCVKIRRLGPSHPRIHHMVTWNNCVPKILQKKWKKS